MPRTARDVVFVDGVRTPFGKAGPTGLYAETRADDMIVSVIRELLRRNPALPPERIGEAVRTALTAARPKTRYTVTPNPLQNLLALTLPKRVVDGVIARRLGLNA